MCTPISYCHNYYPSLTPLVSPMRTVQQLQPSTDIEPMGLDIQFLGLLPPTPCDLATPDSYFRNNHPPLTLLASPMRTVQHLQPSTDIEPTGLDIRFLGLLPPPHDRATPTSYFCNNHPPLTRLVSPMRTVRHLQPSSDIEPTGLNIWVLGLIPAPTAQSRHACLLLS